MYHLVYAEAALRDLFDISDYLSAVQNDHFANLYLERLKVRIETLQRNAHRFRIRLELGPGQRALVSAPYLIFYRIEGQTLCMQRILHGARDIQREKL